MARMSRPVIDADGHVFESDREIFDYAEYLNAFLVVSERQIRVRGPKSRS